MSIQNHCLLLQTNIDDMSKISNEISNYCEQSILIPSLQAFNSNVCDIIHKCWDVVYVGEFLLNKRFS